MLVLKFILLLLALLPAPAPTPPSVTTTAYAADNGQMEYGEPSYLYVEVEHAQPTDFPVRMVDSNLTIHLLGVRKLRGVYVLVYQVYALTTGIIHVNPIPIIVGEHQYNTGSLTIHVNNDR